MKDYIESGMNFIPLFINNNSLYVEKSQFYKNLGEGVRTVEFICLKQSNKLYFIEAKNTAPKPSNKEDFTKYCDEQLHKMQHSMDLFISREVGVNKDFGNEFPDCFIGKKFSEYKIIFLLIIKNHKKEWCNLVLNGLQRKLIALRKIWKIDIAVWNGETALEKRFISEII